MEQIDLAKFNFDVDDVLKGATELKSAIKQLADEQKKLRKENAEDSIQFVENEAKLKALRGEYNRHIKALADTAKQAQDTAIKEQLLEAVMDQEVKTIKEAREQNKLLNELRNNTNIDEESELLQQLNAQLDRNNELIKNNVDAYTQQKINIGNYKEDIKSALEEVNLFNGGIGNITQNFTTFIVKSKEAGGVGALLKTSLSGATQGLLGLTRASLAFIATPVGAVIAVLVAAFLLIKNALDRSEESTNKLKRAFAPFQGILSKVMEFLEPLGEFLIDGIVFAMELAEQAVYALIDGFGALLKFIGFEEWGNEVLGFSNALKQGAQDAKDLADAEAELEKMQRKARLTQLEYQKAAETLRQKRDDEKLSIKERIQANEELGAVLEQQLQDELAIAQKALEVANLRMKAEGESKATLDAQAEALEEIADIEERINSQRSEQLTNRTSLLREAEQKRQEAIDRTLQKMQEELDLYIAQQGERARTLAEELALEQDFANKRKAILDEELKYKRISQTEYDTELLNSKNELARKQAELTVENAARELELYKQDILRKLEAEEFLSQEVLNKRKAQNDALLAQEQEFQKLQLEQGIINQNEYDAAIREAKEANRLANLALDKEREAVEKEEALALRALEFEEELARMLEEGATRLELEKAQADEAKAIKTAEVEAEREQNLISEELYRAKLAKIDRDYKAGEKQREEILAAQKLDAIAGLFSAAAGIIDQNSAVGKSIALAQAGINMYQGISAGVKLGYPQAIPAVAAAVATGGKAIASIAKSKVPSASGRGSVGGSGGAPSSGVSGLGGVNLTGSGANLSTINASNNAAIQNQLEQNASGQNIAQEIGRAAEEGTRRGSQQGSQEGIENLTGNRQIQQNSSF